MPRQPVLSRPDALVREPIPLPSPLHFAYGLALTVAPSLDKCEHLPQLAEHDLPADAARVHEQLDGSLSALKALGDNPNIVKKDEAAWCRY
eukprot:386843-Pleurochrysis_carterae.AAC.1